MLQNKKTVMFFPVLVMLIFLSACQAGVAQDQRPEVTFYAEQSVQMNLHMIIELDHRGRLCGDPSKTVVLEKQSEPQNPWTYFLHGRFYVSMEDKKGIEYGSYFFADVVSENVKRTISAFRRKGTTEKAVGSLAGSGEIFSVSGKHHTHIGQCQFMEVTAPDGERRTVRATRFINPVTPWTVALGDGIYVIENGGKLIQKGWVAWRSIVTPEDKRLVILMTKRMGANAHWAGRYDDVLYMDNTSQ